MCLVGNGASGVEGSQERLRQKGASYGGHRGEPQTPAKQDLVR